MNFEIEIILWLQSFRNGFLDAVFEFFTMFGEELVIIAILGFVYWCFDKKAGEQIGITVFVSLVLNSIIKVLVQRPRPYSVDSNIDRVREATSGGYAFPSGHTQGAASVFGSMAVWFRKRWITITSTIIIVLVALSRMYLGAHYLSDVIVGAGLGIGLSFLGYWYFKKHSTHEMFYRYLIIVSAILGVGLYLYTLFTIEATSELNNAANLFDKLEGTLKMLGVVVGFVLGVTFEKKRVNFTQHSVLWKNIVRFALGVVIVMAVRLGLKFIFNFIVDSDSLQEGQLFASSVALLFDTIRYFAMVFVGIGLYPMLFKNFNI